MDNISDAARRLSATAEKLTASRAESQTIEHATPNDNPSMKAVQGDAQAATAKEHSMTLWKGIKIYPKAIGWSVLFSSAIIMEGYDVVLLGSYYALPPFQRKFGYQQPDGSYEIPASWQAGMSNAMNVGQIIGLFINGFISERLGYKKTMLGSLALVTSFIFILFFAQNKATLLVGELCMGIPLGVFQTLTVTYASEVCPVVLRCYLTTWVNACWVIGQLIGSCVLKSMLSRTDEWAFRIPFAIQWIWPIPIAIGVVFAPESPWWLVRVNRLRDAESSIRRLALSASEADHNPAETVAMMVHTNEIEKEINAGASYAACFKGVDLRRTEISCLTWAVQNLCGAGIMGYSTYFYRAAGLPESQAFTMSIAQYALGLAGTALSWVLMTHFGRRRLYVAGLCTLCAVLLTIGFISFAPRATDAENPNITAAWAIGSMLLLFTFIYDSTVGPICYSLVSEMPSTRLRAKTVVLARNLYNVFSIVNGVIIPYMLNPTAWNWSSRAGFFWGGLCFCSAIWAFLRLPEPKGRTFAELDVLFEKKVGARAFRKTTVDLFGEGEHFQVEHVGVTEKQ